MSAPNIVVDLHLQLTVIASIQLRITRVACICFLLHSKIVVASDRPSTTIVTQRGLARRLKAARCLRAARAPEVPESSRPRGAECVSIASGQVNRSASWLRLLVPAHLLSRNFCLASHLVIPVEI